MRYLPRFFWGVIFATLLFTQNNAVAQAGTEAWVQFYSHPADANDTASKVVTDAQGNVIVAGTTETGITGYDWVIVKYSNSGVALWINRFNGPANDNDFVNAMAIDTDGNIYVTGATGDSFSGSSPNYATVAFNSSGTPLWTNYYDGPAQFDDDYPTAMAVDPTGVYVTGRSSGEGTAFDYGTIAYSLAGTPLWTNRFAGLPNGDDLANAIATDGHGRVYVTGRSVTNITIDDFVTVAYSSAGVPLWTNRYSGPGSNSDEATAIAVAGNGNVLVTGYSYNGSSSDFTTIAYSSNGVPVWTNRYSGSASSEDRAVALTVDDSGRVYVTGFSSGIGSSDDFATMAYSAAGVALWTNRYSGPGNFQDSPAAITVRDNDRVVVTGRTGGPSGLNLTTLAYSISGTPLWTNNFIGVGQSAGFDSGIALDGNGNTFVSGYIASGGSYNWASVAYDPLGAAVWTNYFGSKVNRQDGAKAVVTDAQGNIFVTGHSDDGMTGSDYATVAFHSSGTPLWTNRYHHLYQDQPIALALGFATNVYVTGTSSGETTDKDFATVAYGTNGTALWTNRFSGPGNNPDEPAAIAVGSNGSVYVTGYSAQNGTWVYATVAYGSTGIPLWTNLHDGSAHIYASPTAVAVAPNGNVVVTGASYESGLGSGITTITYSAAGLPVWTNCYEGPSYDDQGNALAIDTNGNIYVTGYSYSDNGKDFLTLAYNPAGTPLWTNRYRASVFYDNIATAIALDPNGNVIVTGTSIADSNTREDFATIAYSSSGLPLWTNRYYEPNRVFETPYSLAVDNDGLVYVTGTSFKDNGGDVITLAYSRTGVPLWTNRYDGPANGYDQVWTKQSLALLPGGVVVAIDVESDLTRQGGGHDFALVKYLNAFPPPSSAVAALPVQAGPTISVSWSGQPGPGGFPPSLFSVFVSTNGVDFTAWLTNTAVTNAIFSGTPGQTYYFYSVAKDYMGNTEAAPGGADGQTTVPLIAPILGDIPDVTIDPGQFLTFTNVTISGTPVGSYEFTLESTSPAGATLTATNGVFRWTPTCSQATTTNLLTVRVRDTGDINLTDTANFVVAVRECVSPQLGRLLLPVGTTGRLPVLLVSSVPLTNLTMQLTLPAGRLINPSLEIIVPEICSSAVQSLASNLYQLSFSACANQSIIGTQQVAWLYMSAASNQPSGFMDLALDQLTGQQPDGSPVANFAPQSGNVIVIADEPLLEASRETSGGMRIIFYGNIGDTNVVLSSTNLALPGAWTHWDGFTFSSLFREYLLPADSLTNDARFFRCYRPQP